MVIRKYENKDFEYVKYICLNDMLKENRDKELIKYVELMFCRYYLEKEPESCFVAVDENDKPIGYIYGAKDYDTYERKMGDYLHSINELSSGNYLADALVEMYDHAIYKDKYPAHLHIDILPEYQSKGIGSKLIEAYCNYIKNDNISGVMLIVGSDNDGAKRFYERNSFIKLHEKHSGAAYGILFQEE